MFEKPARNIVPTILSIIGKLISRKSSGSQHFESQLDRDYLLLHENDHEVPCSTVQTVTITYFLGFGKLFASDIVLNLKL